MKSKHGTRCTIHDRQGNNTVLKPRDICAIIRVCGETGVQELKLGELQISFKADQKALVAHGTQTPTESQESESQPSGLLAVVSEHQTEFEFDEDEQDLKEERLALMQIEDPAGYEKLLASGDLDDGEGAQSRRA